MNLNCSPMKWRDGTPKSQGNAFDWNTGVPSAFALDSYFLAKGKDGKTGGQIASMAREKAEAAGKSVATVGGIGRIVVDTVNSKDFHVHRGQV